MIRAGTGRDIARLPSAVHGAEQALAKGALHRVKIQGQWIYLDREHSLEDALTTAELVLTRPLQEWLLNPARFLVGLALRQPEATEIGRSACSLLLHELCARGRLLGLPLLTRQRQPHLALYTPADSAEIERQVNFLREQLARCGRISWRELPDPSRVVHRKVWRMHLVAHGEWLGLGWQVEPGSLVSW